MPEDKSSKTEKPTAKKRQEARKKGQVPKSMELNSIAVLMVGLVTLFFLSTQFYVQLTGIMTNTFSNAAQIPMEDKDFSIFLIGQAWGILSLLAPVFLLIFCAALLINIFQVGLLFSVENITPKISKISPIKGFSRIFSLRSLMELFKSITKISIIIATAYLTIDGEMDTILGLGQLEPKEIAFFAIRVAFILFIRTCWVLIILAILDYAFQKWQSERDLRMSKEELKEETKQTEGDPHVRARIRTVQRDMARKRMMAAVPEADVVVTNPVHLAVALKYDPLESEAPMVVAKGQSIIAERIKDIAKEHDIPIVENKPLAQGLYKSVEIGEIIPIEFYQAVADVLAYVYQIKGKVING
ncbi:MAG: flagellar biosynthesis protein FlhB [Deltaproteobacteria bacterium]|nr:flagellar biosynthesis protein FlhB [Deltaproteobacteria bacterium]MBW2050830.1 flagellar biosynthesis protein FlhB [Deltaproteobacteria bacterium]MBW2140054.1 flagellar biosynthesis protein FlhB [Deltaproteobacteria bacterium]